MDRLIFKLLVFWTGSKIFCMSNLQFGRVMGKKICEKSALMMMVHLFLVHRFSVLLVSWFVDVYQHEVLVLYHVFFAFVFVSILIYEMGVL